MTRRILLFFISLFILNTLALPVFAAENSIPTVTIGGEQINFKVAPSIEDGTTLVQFRPIFEKLGLGIKWDGDKKQITGSKEGLDIVLTIGSTTATVNGKEITLQKAPKIIDGNTIIPLRFVGESAGNEVKFNKNTMAITINQREVVQVTPEPNVEPTPTPTPTPIPDVITAPKTLQPQSIYLETNRLLTIKFNKEVKSLDVNSISISPNVNYTITTNGSIASVNFSSDLYGPYNLTINEGVLHGSDGSINNFITYPLKSKATITLLSKEMMEGESIVRFHLNQAATVYFVSSNVRGSLATIEAVMGTSQGQKYVYSSGGDYSIDISSFPFGEYSLIVWGDVSVHINSRDMVKAKAEADAKAAQAKAEYDAKYGQFYDK
jgi:hypothetical protein